MNDASGSPEHVERRLRSVLAVGEVVQAIWALARAQLAQIDAGASEASTYLTWIDETVERLAGTPVRQPSEGMLSIVLGPERPFSGSLPREMAHRIPRTGRLGIVGSRFADAVRNLTNAAPRIVFAIPGISSSDELNDGCRAVASALREHAGASRVDVLYPSGGKEIQHAVLLAGEREPKGTAPETLTDASEILAIALREGVSARLRVALAESLATEVSARVAATESARQAIERKRTELEQVWRVLRHEQITTELIELHAGRSAGHHES